MCGDTDICGDSDDYGTRSRGRAFVAHEILMLSEAASSPLQADILLASATPS